MTERKHAAIIKQWADGAAIEYRMPCGKWQEIASPNWHDECEYRVKREYPVTTMGNFELASEFTEAMTGVDGFKVEFTRQSLKGLEAFANAVLRHAIYNGIVARVKP